MSSLLELPLDRLPFEPKSRVPDGARKGARRQALSPLPFPSFSVLVNTCRSRLSGRRLRLFVWFLSLSLPLFVRTSYVSVRNGLEIVFVRLVLPCPPER